MNKQEADILLALASKSFTNQRELANYTDHALGVINKALKNLQEHGFVNSESFKVTKQGNDILEFNKPANAIILAAGFGMRMVPINLEKPKALLTINGEPMIERIIKQLNEAGINEIHIVVGFMKEKFEYLMDKYNVDLIVNQAYSEKNNISSLAIASKHIKNTYIIPSDVWCEKNPFSTREMYSWYMVSSEIDEESDVRVNRKNELVRVGRSGAGNRMIGISYLCGDVAKEVSERIKAISRDPSYNEKFWEEALYDNKNKPAKMKVEARVVQADKVVEINTYEQLRDMDGENEDLRSGAISTIAEVFGVPEESIRNIQVLKKGMTNRSFLFSVDKDERDDHISGGKYIMRIPGEGTDQLINRKEEAEVYHQIHGRGLCDDPVYINPANGYKITKYLEGVRSCDPQNENDLKCCMYMLKRFHEMNLQVNHRFDLFEKVKFYKSLWPEQESLYSDHSRTMKNIFSLKEYIDSQKKECCLTHIDAVSDNFLFYTDECGDEKLQLTDWEYAGMQDPHVDIAMFCIYSLYNKEQCDHLIDIYFENDCPESVRTKIYCYIAVCGMIWSNWCEYKSQLGVEFGEYSLRQYRYAKDFYRYAKERMK